MKTSIERNYDKLTWYADVPVARCYGMRYYAISEWRIRRNKAGEYIAYSSGARTGHYPHIGGTQTYPQISSRAGFEGGGGRRKISPELVAEILRQAQTGKGVWAEGHNAHLAG